MDRQLYLAFHASYYMPDARAAQSRNPTGGPRTEISALAHFPFHLSNNLALTKETSRYQIAGAFPRPNIESHHTTNTSSLTRASHPAKPQPSKMMCLYPVHPQTPPNIPTPRSITEDPIFKNPSQFPDFDTPQIVILLATVFSGIAFTIILFGLANMSFKRKNWKPKTHDVEIGSAAAFRDELEVAEAVEPSTARRDTTVPLLGGVRTQVEH
ncbi:hypothetical protein CC80DRAFT_498933 [Byssothecium circinans]|uniref:Uncharacterized protein n=1 Tax=Byssothecium circinans TaxID=147558 RepID=A0A6A5ULM4_9PLEO|nr:hypothetical protein CC80DRAFT_498933 [Byssothecium circinans]